MYESYKLLEWIPIDRISWSALSGNPNAIHLLENNQDKISWYFISENVNAIHLLEQNLEKINWDVLSRNPNAIHLLEQNPGKINWILLSENSNAINLLGENPNNVNMASLSLNSNTIAMRILQESPWENIWKGTFDIQWIETNMHKALYINWGHLSGNKNAIHLLKRNQDKIDWSSLSKNPSAIELLQCNQDKIDWIKFSMNPSIFEIKYDYSKMVENINKIKEELMMKMFHPRNLSKFMGWGFV